MKEATDLIKQFEGFKEKPYYCPGNILTIGYGHAIIHGEDFTSGISEAEAEALLLKDIERAASTVSRLIPRELSPNQYASLVSFTFNLGSGALQRSTLRQKILRMEDNQVPKEFRKWVYANGRKLKGLILRREAEVNLWLRQKKD